MESAIGVFEKQTAHLKSLPRDWIENFVSAYLTDSLPLFFKAADYREHKVTGSFRTNKVNL